MTTDEYGDSTFKQGESGVYVGKDEYVGPLIAMLPHMCDEWVIGGPEECREMAADLMRAADFLEGVQGVQE